MITGYVVLDCPVCRATKKDLHLKTVAPCSVRCGKCGHKGPDRPTESAAVDSWNNEHFDMGGSV